MKKFLPVIFASMLLLSEATFSQCPFQTAISDVTLQCTSTNASTTRTGIAFNPSLGFYYSVNAGTTTYPIETFSITGGTSLYSIASGADYRGYWWNPNTGFPEGNTYNSGGVYSNSLTTSGYGTSPATYMSAATMPNSQLCGQADITNNIIYYYYSGVLYRYNKTTNSLISSTSVTGLPVGTGNLNMYTVIYTGVPGGEAGVYDYVNRAVYFVNGTTAAYSGSCSLPGTAPTPSSYMMGFANSRIFLFNSSTYQWIGYRIVGPAVSASVSPAAICQGATATLSASGATSYTWNTSSNATSFTVTPGLTTTYTVSATNSVGCISQAVLTLTVNNTLPTLSVTSSTTQVCLGKTVTLTATGAITYTWTGGVTNGAGFVPAATNSYVVTGANACGTGTAATTISVAPLPVAVAISTNIVCSGSPATVTVTAAATSYSWQPINTVISNSVLTVNPLVNTSYTVTAGDGTCSGVATISLATKPIPTISIASSGSVVCQGAPVTLTASGGVTYTWTPGNYNTQVITINPTSATAYSAAGTNSVGCSSGTISVVVTNASPTITAVSSDPQVCPGGSVTLTASGANSYVWSAGPTTSVIVQNPTAPTVYTVTGTTNSCSSTQTVGVDVFIPSVTITGNTVICNGDVANLQANGGTSYTWNPSGIPLPGLSLSPSVTTIYTLNAITSTNVINCASTTTVQVTVNPNPTVSAVSTRTSICKNETTTVNVSGANSYTWSVPGASGTSASITSSVITTLNITITGKDNNNCVGTTTIQVKINACTGLNEAQPTIVMNVFPNPNNGVFTIESDTDVALVITNNLGQVVKTMSLSGANNDRKVQVSGLSSGVYFISGKNGASSFSKKIIVQN